MQARLNSLRESLVSISRVILFLFFIGFLPSDAQRWNGQDFLNVHNYYRCMHGTQPVVWDNGLAASAQSWAYIRQADSCNMIHSGWSGIGENIAAGTFQGVNAAYNGFKSLLDVCSDWYHETFQYNSSTIQTNHFTQILWHSTLRIGCAWAPCASDNWEFWVCQYSPPGNYYDSKIINANVPPPCRSEQGCLSILNNRFSDRPSTSDCFQPNVDNPSSYGYSSNKCLYSGQYTSSGAICPCDSSQIPNILVNISNSRSTTPGALDACVECPSGKSLSGGNGKISCSGGTWSVSGACQ